MQLSEDFLGSSLGEECGYSAGDWGSVPGSGRSPEEGKSNPLQNSFLRNPMDRGASRAAVNAVTSAGHD